MPNSTPTSISIAELAPDPTQPRREFAPDDHQRLVESIRACGILQPIRVRQASGVWFIIDGERRWRAAQDLGLNKVPIVVEDREIDAGDVVLQQLGCNLARCDLTAIEKGEAIRHAMSLTGRTAGEVASAVGLSAAHASKLLAILELPEGDLERARRGSLGVAAAYRLVRTRRAGKQSPAHPAHRGRTRAATTIKPSRLWLGKGLTLLVHPRIATGDVIRGLTTFIERARDRLEADGDSISLSSLADA
ncbi:MAG: ParB/RepB/Spo0J family partition protein [Phycisphaerales bacterium]